MSSFSPISDIPHADFFVFPTPIILVGRPISDDVSGAWLPSTGIDLFATIDEDIPSDTDYDYTTVASTFQVALSAPDVPAPTDVHLIKYRIQGTRNLTVTLKEGASTIASWAHTPAPASWTTFEQSLSSGEISSITDYSNLRLEFISA